MKNPFLAKPLWWTALLIATILLLIPIWYFQFLPLNDWPNHLAGVHLIVQYDAGNPQYVQPNTNLLLPNSADFWFMRILGPIVGVETSGRILLSLTIILMVWGSAYFMRQIHPDLEPLGGAGGAALAYNWFFLMGFLNYALSIPLFLIACGYWMKNAKTDGQMNRRPGGKMGWREYAAAAALAAFTTFTHLVAGLVLIAVIGMMRAVEVVQTAFKNRSNMHRAVVEASARNLAWDTAFVAPVLLISLLSLPSLITPEEGGRMVMNGPLSALNYLLHTPPNPALAIIFFVVAATSIWIWLGSDKIKFRLDAGWLAVAAALAIGALFLPESTASWQFAAPRLWPFFIYAFVAAVFSPLAKQGAKQMMTELTIALLILMVAETGIMTIGWMAEQPNMAAVASVADHLTAGAAVLPIGEGFAMMSNQSSVTPYFHAWGYWVMQKDVYVPYVFAEKYTPIQYIDPGTHDRAELNTAMSDLGYKVFAEPTNDKCKYWKEYYQQINWTKISQDYDYVVLRAGACENTTVVPSPFVQVWAEGPLYVFENGNRTRPQ